MFFLVADLQPPPQALKLPEKIRGTQQQHAALSAANEQDFKIKAAVNHVPELLGRHLGTTLMSMRQKSEPELLNIIFVLRE